MFFPETPEFISDLLEVSISRLLLGKRVEGVGSNGRLHRYFGRLVSNQAVKTSKVKLRSLWTAIWARHLNLSEPSALDQMREREFYVGNSLDSAWQSFALGCKFDIDFPRTANLVAQFEIASRRIALDFKGGRASEGIEALGRLPWAKTATMLWYVTECEHVPSNAFRASFPMQFLSLLIVLKAISDELREPGDNRPGCLTPLITSRDPSTGGLIALRIWFDRVQEVLGVSSQDAMFRIILSDFGSDDGTRIREVNSP